MNHRPLRILNFIEPSSRIRFLVRDIGTSHDLENFKWLLAERTQNIVSLTHNPFAPFLHAGTVL
jgi:hypothetical protein